MRFRRAPKPKVTPMVRVKVDGWTIRDPAGDEREAQVEICAWADCWTAAVPRLPVIRLKG